MSRRTVFSLLLLLLVPLSLRAWVLQHRDDCDRPGPHGVMPASVYVDTGTRTVEMPCNVWLVRQPAGVQIVCLGELAVGMVFLLGVWGDWRRWQDRRQSRQNYQGNVLPR